MKRLIGIGLIRGVVAVTAFVGGGGLGGDGVRRCRPGFGRRHHGTGLAAGLIPDTVPLDNDITINDTPDPVAPGGTVHYDLDVPFPDLTGDLPAL